MTGNGRWIDQKGKDSPNHVSMKCKRLFIKRNGPKPACSVNEDQSASVTL